MGVLVKVAEVCNESADHKLSTIFLKDHHINRKQSEELKLFSIRGKKKGTPFKKSYPHHSTPSHSAESDMHLLNEIIEDLKRQLNQLVSEKGLADESVLKLSQRLDQYILKYQLFHYKRKKQ